MVLHIEPEFSSDNNVLQEKERIKEQNIIWHRYEEQSTSIFFFSFHSFRSSQVYSIKFEI